ncbi:MAG: GldM family protein [Bacteroidales bacterium]|nr:GldM family protein [Bacteroidales bacterium]
MGATNCPETPRQKMIGMMYLVYTALLALNVSAEILTGFVTVGDAMNQSNLNIATKLDDSYSRFQAAYVNNPEKVQDHWNKAQQVQKLSDALKGLIDSARFEFISIMQAEAIIEDHSAVEEGGKVVTRKIPLVDASGAPLYDSIREALNVGGLNIIDKKDNVESGTNYFYGTGDVPDGKAIQIKEKIIEYKQALKKVLGPDSSAIKIGLNVEEKRFSEHAGQMVEWENLNFYRTIAVADLVVLSRLKAEVMNAEFDAVNTLFSQISADDFKFDHVQALIIPKSTYIIQGGKYEADIFVGAYDSKASLKVNVNSQELSGDSVVHYTAGAGALGQKKLNGKIYVKKDNSEAKEYPFSAEYFVAEPVAVVSLTKMNVVYAGIDNPVSIGVPGVASRDVSPSITGGATIKPDPAGKAGDYIIRATKIGKIQLNVSAKTDGKTMRQMGTKELRVKKIPKPVLKVGNFKTGDNVTKAELSATGQLRAVMEDFDFQIPALRISSFTFNVQGSGALDITANGSRLTPEMISRINNARRGQKVYITDVTVKTPDGATHTLDATFRLK